MIEQSTTALLALLSRGEVTSESLTDAYLRSIRERDARVRAFLHVDETSALTQAGAIDARRKKGEPLGVLAGLPVAVKDVLCTRGQPTTEPSGIFCAIDSPSERKNSCSACSM